jgi:hypothetical protein
MMIRRELFSNDRKTASIEPASWASTSGMVRVLLGVRQGVAPPGGARGL